MSLVGRGGIILIWFYREVNTEVVGMCVEVVPVLSVESVDFLFN
jgi:hypothetical protein